MRPARSRCDRPAMLAIAHIFAWFFVFSNGHQLAERDDSLKIPAAISIAPSQYWDGLDGPWSSFPLQVGTGSVSGTQDVRVFPSTACADIWTIDTGGCPPDYVVDCETSRGSLFEANKSLTYVQLSAFDTGLEFNLGLNTGGDVGFDTVTLGWPGSGGPTTEHNVIFSLSTSTFWLGLFGLNPRPTNFTDDSSPQPSFMQRLYNGGHIPSLSFAYTAGAYYRLQGVFGSMVLGGYDSNKFIANEVTFQFYQDISRDLTVNLQSITADMTVKAGASKDLLPGGSIPIFIDSTVAPLWLPESACRAFEDAFGIEYDDSFVPGFYLVNSSHRDTLLNINPTVILTLGPKIDGGPTVPISLPYRAFDKEISYPYIMNPNTSYYFPLQRAANSTQYTLGRTFLQEAYLIADYNRQNFSIHQNVWTLEAVQSQTIVNILSPSIAAQVITSGAEPMMSTPVIAGIAIAGTAAIVCSIALLFFLRRRKQRLALSKASRDDSSTSLNDTSMRTSDGTAFPQHYGELGSAQVNELDYDAQVRAELCAPEKQDRNAVGYSEMETGDVLRASKYGAVVVHEMSGLEPVYEMPAAEVAELPTSTPRILSSRSNRRALEKALPPRPKDYTRKG